MSGYDGSRSLQHSGMDHPHYAYSAAPGRSALQWPGGARVALIVLIHVEAAVVELPDPLWAPREQASWMDVSAWSLHEYGRRVGIFRLGRVLDELGLRATMSINDLALKDAPRLVDFARERSWELVAHGRAANMLVTSALSSDAELGYLQASRQALAAASGTLPRGWASPQMSESHRTPALAAEAGYEYLLDWGNDDQPYPFISARTGLVSIPVSVDTSDHLVLAAGSAQTPWEHAETMRDHLDELRVAEPSGRVMTVSLKAHLSGQPFRSRYVRDFLTYARSRGDVWFATAGEVLDAYRSAAGGLDTAGA